MVDLIPLVGILGDSYKIPITHYVRLSIRVLGMLGFIMIDQTNVVEFESVGDFWSVCSS